LFIYSICILFIYYKAGDQDLIMYPVYVNSSFVFA